MKKSFLITSVLSLVLVINTSTHNSIWPDSQYITNDGKNHCVQFQFLKGSNRTADFKRVFELTFDGKLFENKKSFSTTKFTLTDIKKMYGQPDVELNENSFSYNLNPDVKNCVAEFNYDKVKHTISCITQNCN